MATEEDYQQIDIWSNRDGSDVVTQLIKDLSRIFLFPINCHDTAELSDPAKYNSLNGTIILVVTPDTLRMLNTTPNLNFSALQTTKPSRYYIDNDDILADHNTRVQLVGGEATWCRIDMQTDNETLQGLFREIVQNAAIRGADPNAGSTMSKRKGKIPSRKGQRGAFTVIPNHFYMYNGMIKKEKGASKSGDGTLIIEPSQVPWKFVGDPLTGYLVNQSEKVPEKRAEIEIEITKLSPPNVYSFKLPEVLEPSTYMVHLRDGALPSDHELGNRRIVVRSLQSSGAYISLNLFGENHLAWLSEVPDFSSPQHCKQADTALCSLFEKSQLPLMLPRVTGTKFPTLMHVACFYGMENLFRKIIDSYCSLSALNITNVDLKTPINLADEQGHSILAELLRNQLMIQDMYVSQYSHYVRLDPAVSDGDFYDTVCSFPFLADDGYVTGAKTVHENEDSEYVYTVAGGSRPLPEHSVSYSPQAPLEDQHTPHPQSATICSSSSLFEHDIPSDALVPDDISENFPKELKQIGMLIANGEININLAEKHLRDWTKRMNSLKLHEKLEKRLELQIALKKDMSERYIDKQEEPPTIAPRKISTTQQRVKKLPAVPPSSARNQTNSPVVPPRILPSETNQSYRNRMNMNEDVYLVPSPAPPVKPRT
ncbi:uncharacterized protein [Watersipora subatra]|uniref:uncharacterized protein n=1 Tax=Watersipora subatra TaxID=2589382 RepID=UPI00355C79DE